ncbi:MULTISPECIES: response regulator [Methylobacteriaceae]|uniref:Transcriptional regulatory protein QseB n=2 Tax=Methylobacterium TaxID=407 RepID=A0ABQ4SS13_9HYPH|nr:MULTISPECIES: response regulator [Methylobacterium]PIU05471.1 MAG: DNA-binding response regulator [Methylobacterium sp. CG09_land_8_20_14_0_10_71_15]PIU13022.1 MAG: DNA-binding response regulator [Methylobacterium sp. CG08_land_8_20_14_0_20_71_15]GBU15833.1 quorum sensing DNA-binding response regulator in two-component regulatory system with QseC [Methylobacterium sp.]GJE05290.1 Transcriptional regulatory protein QseB [Methylobacterium jeotgali]
MRILVVEDDTILSDGLRAGLGLGGATVDCVATCADAEAALATSAFSAIVLDLMLPDGSGLDVLRGLRRRNDRTPVVLLTARDAVADRIAGLDGGADDYLGKPFDLDELSARIRAVVRRASGRAAAILEHGAIRLDPGSLAVTVDGAPVTVSRREVMVLAALMERPDVLRSKAELEERLYGWQEEVESNAVEVHVHNLRAKIGRHAIETVRGLGYRMRALT